ncbi:MAG: hypothetical protein JETT_3185 [Candidatus Jettenia ecosi]|uniref:Four helix bundle protein n=1 Tax=Candidatus Jettenia ecosi TaxID=2494326 RepID=A0A533Q7E7_9BACT|nr:MAG: hypothetical protein JETT_3185 [Candidatus Jettenia ecosi]
MDHLTTELDENYASEEEFEILKKKIFKVIKILNGYISFLKKCKNST